MAAIAVILVAIVCHTYNWQIILGAISVFIATGAGNTINDYFDYEIDKINKPHRPIPSKRISLRNALIYSIILFIIAAIMGFYINIYNGLLVIICDILMIIYAYDLKQRCLIGNITVSLLTGLTFIYGGLIIGNIFESALLGLFAFLMTLSREIIKDTEDIEGDSKENANTLPIKYGVDLAINCAIILNVITCLLSPILYLLGLFNAYYLIIVLIADIIFIYSAIVSYKDKTPKNLHKVAKYMKIAMMIAFISFIIGSL